MAVPSGDPDVRRAGYYRMACSLLAARVASDIFLVQHAVLMVNEGVRARLSGSLVDAKPSDYCKLWRFRRNKAGSNTLILHSVVEGPLTHIRVSRIETALLAGVPR